MFGLLGCSVNTQKNMKTNVELLSPEGLHKNPAYSQVAIVEGNYRTIYIGGQNAVDKDGNIAMPFCTEGMYRGYVKGSEKPVVKIYK